jgi:nicotinate-nucleotide--dimethylbenzimidazole phosphoribosyltransferase
MTNSWELLATTIANVGELDGSLMEMAGNRQLQLTKPVNALGMLERLSIRLAGITGQLRPSLMPRSAIICAGDNGIAREGVSAFAPTVTAQMVRNLLLGGAAVNVLARQFDVNVAVLDVGVAADLADHTRLRKHKIRYGTQNFAYEPAMTRQEAVAAIEAGIQTAMAEVAAGARLLVAGDIGIGGTTVGAAIAALMTELPISQVTGMGTGIGLLGWRRKCEVIDRALALHLPDPNDPIDVLSKVGSFEICAVVGVIIAAAASRVPVLIDGIGSTTGAAIAAKLCVGAKSFMIAAHRGVEPGQRALLEHLDLTPVLELDLALGEGVGSILAIPMLEAAVATLNEMATFDDAQIERPRPLESSAVWEPTFA